MTKADLVGPIYNLLKGTCKSCVELESNMEECYRALFGRLTIPDDFFFNNDLEYLRGGSTDRKYTTSTTKTKHAKYDAEGIEDLVPNLWSPVKVVYDKLAALRISHWGAKRQRFYGYVINKKSRHDAYSTLRILSVASDFPKLHLNDIEGMLLLVAQNNLKNLDEDVIVHLAVGLRMYTRRIVIQSRVKDLHLGVESYQKKLNISKPRTRDIDLSRKSSYTTLSDPQGVIYKDKLKRKRLMRTEELYKFSDGTLTSVCNTLDQILKNLRLGYNKDMKRKKWTATDQRRNRIMFKDINQQVLHRRIMRSLEKFVGGRDYGTDYRLLQRTV
ncbi:hypothetical protein Tco_1085207 [Tanacetum coccineum]